MTQRRWLALLPLALGGAFLLFLFFSLDHEDGIPLAELAPDSPSSAAGAGFSIGDSLESGAQSLASLGLEPIFYGVLGLCGLVLALRVVISVLRSMREQHSIAPREPASRIIDAPLQLRRAETPDFPPARAAIAKVAPSPVAGLSSVAEFRKAIRLRDQVPRSAHGPVARLMFASAGIIAAFGILSAALVYFRLTSALSEHALQRAKVTAVNVSDGASTYLFKKNAAGLRELLRKYANRPELAYIVVEDRAQRILAHSFAVLPAELSERAKIRPDSAGNWRTVRVGGNPVHEVTVPIMEGRAGAVRVGIWSERMEKEISETVKPLITWLACVAAGGILAAVLFAWRINRPIFRLVSAAQAISRGDLDTPSPNVGDPGEFGELSRALERLRSSMKAALVRLGQ